MTKETRDHQAINRRHWEAHLRAAAKSGLSRSEYCRRHSLSYHAMGYWHKWLSRDKNRQTLVLKPEDVVNMAGGPLAVVDCFGILDDATIERYFELGCEVKGLGRGHLKRIKDAL